MWQFIQRKNILEIYKKIWIFYWVSILYMYIIVIFFRQFLNIKLLKQPFSMTEKFQTISTNSKQYCYYILLLCHTGCSAAINGVQPNREKNDVWIKSTVWWCWMCGDIGVRRPTILWLSDIGLASHTVELILAWIDRVCLIIEGYTCVIKASKIKRQRV